MKRYLQIDFIRGLLLIIMTVDHLSSPLRRFTYQSFGFVSGAEGFVFVSGLVSGIVLSKIAFKQDIRTSIHKMHSRAIEIYKYHLAILFILLVLIYVSPIISEFWTEEDPLLRTQPWLAVILTSVFFYQPDHLNILPIYCIFLLFAPLALKLLVKEKFVPLLAISWGLWLISIFGFRDLISGHLSKLGPIDLGYFNVYSWQVLFYSGMFFGHLKWKNTLDKFARNNALFAFCIIICSVLFIVKHFVVDGAFANHSFYTDKTDLGPLRLLNFFALAYVISFILNKYHNFGKFAPIAFLGKHSLQVFAFHVVLTIIIMPIVANLEHHLSNDIFSLNGSLINLLEILFTILSVLALFIPAILHESSRKKPLKKYA